jgi:hypothetical protein
MSNHEPLLFIPSGHRFLFSMGTLIGGFVKQGDMAGALC